ncbi:MAG: toll/interleukin-1 receptor domain-containing protein [Terriglobia bacterium]
MAGGRVFINYRRDDSRADAGRIYDRLSVRYPGKVFRDVGSLEPGVEWREAIEKVLSASDACIVVIGKNWLSITDAAGHRRLDDSRDTVRTEVLAALQHKMRVIPVLVGGAPMPEEEDLPEDLQPLARRNALQITEQDWDEDMAKLIRALDQALGLPPEAIGPAHGRAEISAKVSFFHGRFAFAFTGVLALSLMVAVLVSYNKSHESSSGPLTADNSAPVSNGTAPPSHSAAVSSSSAPAITALRPTATPTTESRASKARGSPAGSGLERSTVPTVEAVPAAPAAPPPPVISASRLTGSWQALVTSPGQQLGEEGALYEDGSFLLTYQGSPAAVGSWRYDAGKQEIDILNGATFPYFGVRFGCALGAGDGQGNSFRGTCVDARRDSLSVGLTRAQKNPVSESRPVIPGLDLSSLSVAESMAFAQMLAREPCTCGCGLNLLACRRSQTERCMLSLNIARQRLQQFYYNMRR